MIMKKTEERKKLVVHSCFVADTHLEMWTWAQKMFPYIFYKG